MTTDRIDDPIPVPERLREILGERPEAVPENRHWFPPLAWWRSLEATERVLYRGLVLVAVGLGIKDPAIGILAAGLPLVGLALFTIAVVTWRSR